MIYELKKVEDQLVAIKDPRKVLYQVFLRSEETTTPSRLNHNRATRPSSLLRLQPRKQEQTEETAPTEQQTEESESAQL